MNTDYGQSKYQRTAMAVEEHRVTTYFNFVEMMVMADTMVMVDTVVMVDGEKDTIKAATIEVW
jgi:hypothetical protein